jgi:LuxR family transcriptional regulator, maltose regulon positive regulatory protein
MRQVDDLLKRRPGLGALVEEVAAFRGLAGQGPRFRHPRSVGADRCRAPAAPAAVHLPVVPADRREMVLSRYTIKSQAMSIYCKLGGSSRSQAVARSREQGLLEG